MLGPSLRMTKKESTPFPSPLGCAQKPPLNAHVDVSSRARGLKFGLRLYSVCSSSEATDETAHLRRLA